MLLPPCDLLERFLYQYQNVRLDWLYEDGKPRVLHQLWLSSDLCYCYSLTVMENGRSHLVCPYGFVEVCRVNFLVPYITCTLPIVYRQESLDVFTTCHYTCMYMYNVHLRIHVGRVALPSDSHIKPSSLGRFMILTQSLALNLQFTMACF